MVQAENIDSRCSSFQLDDRSRRDHHCLADLSKPPLTEEKDQCAEREVDCQDIHGTPLRRDTDASPPKAESDHAQSRPLCAKSSHEPSWPRRCTRAGTPADRPFSDVFHYPVCSGDVSLTGFVHSTVTLLARLPEHPCP